MGLAEESIVKLASNENPLGVGEKTRAAMYAALADIARYPDGNGFELKDALRRRYGVELNQIVLGNGSNDILEMVAGALLGPEREAVFAQHAFAIYPLATQAAGARGIEVRAKNFGHDLNAMLAAITPATRVVFIANPNNPTGTFVPEYLAPEQRYDAVAWITRFPNLLVSRTFSKAYGLAGLRVGYGLGSPEVIDLLNRVRQPFNVCSVGLAAAAAALFDDEFLQRSYELNRDGMTQLTDGFRRLGLDWIPSAGNFVTFKVGDGADVNLRLLRQGVIVRPIGGYGLPDHLRITIGLDEHNRAVVEALAAFVKS